MPTTSSLNMHRVVLYLPDWMIYCLDVEALEEQVSRSEIVRRWLLPTAKARRQ